MVFSCNCAICTGRWICPKWPKEGFRPLQQRKPRIWWRNFAPKSEKRRSGALSVQCIERWRPQEADTRLCYVNIKWTDTFLAKIAAHTFYSLVWNAKELVPLHLSNAERRYQSRHNFCPKLLLCLERHLCHQKTTPEPNVYKSPLCWPDMHLYIQLFPVLNSVLSGHMPRIGRTIQILIHMFWLMKEQTLVSILCTVFECWKHSFCRLLQPIARNWQ